MIKNFELQMSAIMDTRKKIVLFGAMAMGEICYRAVHALNREVYCFVDNNPNKHGKHIANTPINPLESLVGIKEEVLVVICSFNPKTIRSISDQLEEIGITDYYDPSFLYSVYQVKVVGRDVSLDNLEATISILKHPEGKTILKNVIVYVTEKCSLKCRDCSAFVQYIEKPIHYDKDKIIQSMKALSDSVDAIESLSILGGEPLLHPHIGEICEAASKLTNVSQIRLATNGTIIPDSGTVDKLRRSVFYTAISNYGELSKNKQKIRSLLDDAGIYCEVENDNLQWYQIFSPQDFSRNSEEDQNRFDTCVWKSQSAILQDGQFHLCGYSANGHKLGFFSAQPEEYVNLVEDFTPGHKQERVFNLINRTRFISACKYCDIHGALNTSVPRAVQTKTVLKLKSKGE